MSGKVITAETIKQDQINICKEFGRRECIVCEYLHDCEVVEEAIA